MTFSEKCKSFLQAQSEQGVLYVPLMLGLGVYFYFSLSVKPTISGISYFL